MWWFPILHSGEYGTGHHIGFQRFIIDLYSTDIKTRSDVVMIGDRKYDIEGAKANNIDSIGVLYGYGDEEELANAGANKIVTDIKELSSFLLTGNIPI